MLRTLLATVAVCSLTLLSGCGLCGDRGPCRQECYRGGMEAIPVSFPTGGTPCCGPVGPGGPGGPIVAGPITNGPIYPGTAPGPYPLSETLPPPYASPPRIPKAGIDEKKGKEFELEGRASGPVLAMPATGTR
jgi:hypothetical protein